MEGYSKDTGKTYAFGDYDTFHPTKPDLDPREVKENPSLRYTIEGAWLVLNEKDIDTLTPKQFQAICKELVESGVFCGKDFSWGDNYIYRASQSKEDVKNKTLWRKACSNHHIQFITDSMKKLK
ncbi:MAG TPA: hypothetical protein VEC36_08410 [Patescibacteria group bacterium]|nr:hypothetical protein [Patescibacteria group bacterium]